MAIIQLRTIEGSYFFNGHYSCSIKQALFFRSFIFSLKGSVLAPCFSSTTLPIPSSCPPMPPASESLGLLRDPSLLTRHSQQTVVAGQGRQRTRTKKTPLWGRKLPQLPPLPHHVLYGMQSAQIDLSNGWRTTSRIANGCFLTQHRMPKSRVVIVALPRPARLASISRWPNTSSQSTRMRGSGIM